MKMKNNNYYRPLLKPVTKPIGKTLILNTYFVANTGVNCLLCIIYLLFSVSFRYILVYSIQMDLMLDGVVGASAGALALYEVKAKLISVLAK